MGEAKIKEEAAEARQAALEEKTCPGCGKLRHAADGSPDLALLSRPVAPVVQTMDTMVVLGLGLIQHATTLRNAARYLDAGHATTGAVADAEGQLVQVALTLHDALGQYLAPVLQQRAREQRRIVTR